MANAKCRELEPLFTPYVDGEAAEQDRAVVDAHLAKCPPCRARVAGERTAREVLTTRRAGISLHAPAQLRARCAACARGTGTGPASVVPFVRRAWIPMSLAATIAFVAGWIFLFGINSRVEGLANQLALDHVKCFQFPPSHVPADGVAASREWASAHGWALRVPASVPAEELELVGMRRCASTEGRVAHIMYRWHGAPLSIYVFNRAIDGITTRASATDEIRKLGEEAVFWSSGGRTYAVVGRRDPFDMQHLAQYVKRTAQ